MKTLHTRPMLLALTLSASVLAQTQAPAFTVSTHLISSSAATSLPTDAQMTDPASTDWLSTGRDFGGQRHSPLKQINAGNAASLQKVCTLDLHLSTTFETSLIEVGGTLYFTTPSGTYAADATTCKLRWHTEYAYRTRSSTRPSGGWRSTRGG